MNSTSTINALPSSSRFVPHWLVAILFLLLDFFIFGTRRRQRILQYSQQKVASASRAPTLGEGSVRVSQGGSISSPASTAARSRSPRTPPEVARPDGILFGPEPQYHGQPTVVIAQPSLSDRSSNSYRGYPDSDRRVPPAIIPRSEYISVERNRQDDLGTRLDYLTDAVNNLVVSQAGPQPQPYPVRFNTEPIFRPPAIGPSYPVAFHTEPRAPPFPNYGPPAPVIMQRPTNYAPFAPTIAQQPPNYPSVVVVQPSESPDRSPGGFKSFFSRNRRSRGAAPDYYYTSQ